MSSFDIIPLLRDYKRIISGSTKATILIRFIVLPILLALFIISFIKFDSAITDIFGIIISILIGLLFSFVVSLGERINSDKLNQMAKEKLKRLRLVEETYTAAFISILISVFCLILIFLVIITYEKDKAMEITEYVILSLHKIFSFCLVLAVYHLLFLLILMINRLKKLLDTDVKEERSLLQERRRKESDEWD